MNTKQQRAAFESAYIGASSLRLEDIELEYDDAQKRYLDDQAQSTWEGWQMGIALDRQQRGEAYVWQPPGRCVTCNGEGIVGNVLNAQPCPDCLAPQPADPVVRESRTTAEPESCPARELGREIGRELAGAIRGSMPPAEPVKCQDPNMGAHACSDKAQCWEPCGELGKSEAHVRAVPEGEQDADKVDAAFDPVSVDAARAVQGRQP